MNVKLEMKSLAEQSRITLILLLFWNPLVQSRQTIRKKTYLQNSKQEKNREILFEPLIHWIERLRNQNYTATTSTFHPQSAVVPPGEQSIEALAEPLNATRVASSSVPSIKKKPNNKAKKRPGSGNIFTHTSRVRCTCNSCSETIWNRPVDGNTCGQRIEYLSSSQSLLYPTELSACSRVAEVEFPDECGACDPKRCDGRTPPREQDFYCGCKTCTRGIWKSSAGGVTCEARITWVRAHDNEVNGSEKLACRKVANEFPTICGPACNPDLCDNSISAATPIAAPLVPTKKPVQTTPASTPAATAPREPDYYCGCKACTRQVWKRNAGGYTCEDRIAWVKTNDEQASGSEKLACRKVANEFPSICGPACNPDLCDLTLPDVKPIEAPGKSPDTPPAGQGNLYCFPDWLSRKRYTNVWRDYIVEVKESESVCGPGNNRFSRNTVSLSGNDLTLQFKVVNGVWQGSEVRVLPSSGNPFSYGTYSFSVKKVSVKDGVTGITKANDIPPSLIIGLFSWDPKDDYAIHENYSHEVDIEISRWNNRNDMDAQFLLQPPGEPQMYRFKTGTQGARNPGGHTYQFTWNPGVVTWFTDAGGGHTHRYSTLQTIQEGVPDFVQCLPANLEIRMNLWNMLDTQTPTDMASTDIAEVVIDEFKYIPSNRLGVPNGQACTKDCQCMPSSQCANHICARK